MGEEPDRYAWHADARCRDAESFDSRVDFFSDSIEMNRYVKLRYCDGCPVSSECLEDAIRRNEQHGLWGGFTTAERMYIKRKRMRDAKRAG